MSNRKVSALTAVLALATFACTDATGTPKATTIEVNSVADQQGFTGTFAAENPEVLVRGGNGQPISGVTVKFAVTAGGGSISNATTVSGPRGRATAGAWTLGPSVGVNTVVGSVDGVGSVQFKAEAVPVPAGTFQLTTVDGLPLPFRDPSSAAVLTSGTFTLTAARAYTLVLQIRTFDDGDVNEETSGSFAPKSPKGLSFYLNGFPWIDGTLEGNTLTAGIGDLSDNLRSYVFVREISP